MAKDCTIEINGKSFPIQKEVFDLIESTSRERDKYRNNPKKVVIDIDTDVLTQLCELIDVLNKDRTATFEAGKFVDEVLIPLAEKK